MSKDASEPDWWRTVFRVGQIWRPEHGAGDNDWWEIVALTEKVSMPVIAQHRDGTLGAFDYDGRAIPPTEISLMNLVREEQNV